MIHKDEHNEFKKKTLSFCLDTMAHKETIATEILSFLKNWLVTHVLSSDKDYKECFNAGGVY